MAEYHPLSDAELWALMAEVNGGVVGDETAFACNADPDEHIHIRRIGKRGGGLQSRVALFAHLGDPSLGVTIFLSSEEARVFAAKVLDAADDVDADVPLTYAAPCHVPPWDLDEPDVSTDPHLDDPDEGDQ